MGTIPIRSYAAPEEDKAPDEKQTELGRHMDTLNKAYRKLRRQIADPTKYEDSLKLVAVMRENAEASVTLVPEKAEDVPAADRAKFIEDYQKSAKRFVEQIVKVEAALKLNDNEAAQKTLAGFSDIQKESHKEFRKPDDHKKS
jgi:soluble cytochrome b562